MRGQLSGSANFAGSELRCVAVQKPAFRPVTHARPLRLPSDGAKPQRHLRYARICPPLRASRPYFGGETLPPAPRFIARRTALPSAAVYTVIVACGHSACTAAVKAS